MSLSKRPALRFVCLVAAISAVVSICRNTGAAPPAVVSHYEKVLLEKQIKPDANGLSKYFRELHPSEAQRERAKRLIQQLGSRDSFSKRETATAQLLVLPVLPNESLIAASKGPDPEIRWRAKKILELGKPESERVLFAAFKTIEQKRIGGLMAELLRAIPLCDKSHLRFAARQAVRAIAHPKNANALRRALQSTIHEVRIAAIVGLGKALGKKSVADLHPLLGDSQDRIKLAAARAVADFGDRKCLSPLLRLLSSAEINVRTSAAVALRGLSGKYFGFAAYDTQEKRSAAAAKWKTWIANEGQTAKLSFPLKLFGAHSHLGGNTLLAFGYVNKVVEYDPSGKEVWSYNKNIAGAWSAEKMANGNVLIAAHSQNRVVEVDPQGNVVWEYVAQGVLNAKPLANGNKLIAEYGKQRVIEVTPDKKIVWQYATKGSCGDVHRLQNGNTLLASWGAPVVEVTPAGKVVWQYPVTNTHCVQPLQNGNVLIGDWNRGVIEVTRDLQIVWEYKVNSPADVFRLPNGNTLITSSNRFLEVTPDKKIIWSKTGCNYGSARR